MPIESHEHPRTFLLRKALMCKEVVAEEAGLFKLDEMTTIDIHIGDVLTITVTLNNDPKTPLTLRHKGREYLISNVEQIPELKVSPVDPESYDYDAE